ncbi:MAG: VIT1/CCC1 transporter family protein [Dehalococcoidales bacterium]|nr:VIT1/CCC1 transporter family protein [Dehalococcoidales bacterium]
MIGNFLRGYIDGSLSTLGIVVGASSASESVIIAAAVGGTIANGIANILSASSAAKAESHSELRDIEKAMVTRDLTGTAADRKIGKQSLFAGIADGSATVVGGIVPILPLFLLDSNIAIWISIGLVVFTVVLIGLYLGKLSKQNLLISGIKMAVYSISVAVAVYFVQGWIV